MPGNPPFSLPFPEHGRRLPTIPSPRLSPKLGTIVIDDQSFVIADIPGLIRGAHEGAGLGDRFLGHIERSGVLIHLVDGTEEDVAGAYKTIRAELDAYGQGLEARTELVCLNKADGSDRGCSGGTPHPALKKLPANR